MRGAFHVVERIKSWEALLCANVEALEGHVCLLVLSWPCVNWSNVIAVEERCKLPMAMQPRNYELSLLRIFMVIKFVVLTAGKYDE